MCKMASQEFFFRFFHFFVVLQENHPSCGFAAWRGDDFVCRTDAVKINLEI